MNGGSFATDRRVGPCDRRCVADARRKGQDVIELRQACDIVDHRLRCGRLRARSDAGRLRPQPCRRIRARWRNRHERNFVLRGAADNKTERNTANQSKQHYAWEAKYAIQNRAQQGRRFSGHDFSPGFATTAPSRLGYANLHRFPTARTEVLHSLKLLDGILMFRFPLRSGCLTICPHRGPGGAGCHWLQSRCSTV
jgi:hypothetical protein